MNKRVLQITIQLPEMGRITLAVMALLLVALITAAGSWAGGSPALAQTGKSGGDLSDASTLPLAICPPNGQCFVDVPAGNPFYAFINRIYQQDLVTGYPCGGPGEPCDAEHRPYYRPVNNVTRQQMAKFIDNARRLPEIHMLVASGPAPIFSRNDANTAMAAYSTSGQALVAQSQSQSAIYAQSGDAAVITAFSTGGPNSVGVYGDATTGLKGNGETGVSGTGSQEGVHGSSPTGVGVHGESNSSTGNGVWGENSADGGTGVYGEGAGDTGVGVHGQGIGSGQGVEGSSPLGTGVRGDSSGPYGYGVYGSNTGGGDGVYGVSDSGGTGVYGTSTTNGYGVRGSSNSSAGVFGGSNSGHGVEGSSGTGAGIYGTAGSPAAWAGYFVGNVNVTGSCCGAATGTTRIDDPLDPTNKYLNQSFVESPDMIDVLRGHVVLDANGETWVEVPSWFQVLNHDFDYQLTCVGGYAPVYVAQELENSRFQIAGGKAGIKVSWQVTGTRHDPYALAHPIQAEEDKPADERGRYLHPAEYGQPESSVAGDGNGNPQVQQPASKP